MVSKQNKNSGKNNLLFYLALILLIVAVVVFFLNISQVVNLTGKAIGTANLTVESITEINFTTNNIDWGSGAVTSGQSSATLNTAGDAANVTNGNWTGNTAGLVIENIGNVNVSLNISAGKTATTLLGGLSPTYEYNFSNIEANSCSGGTTALNEFTSANTSVLRVCGIFDFSDDSDRIRIDIKLVVPSDSKTGAIGDIITATATAV